MSSQWISTLACKMVLLSTNLHLCVSFYKGTHVCSIPGVYVLQWKYKSGAPTGQAHGRHTRAKVMYYHEVLPSRDFR